LLAAWLIVSAGPFYFCIVKDVLFRIEIIRGDITKQRTDAIVNAANSSLMGGGGVDGAIHRAGGPAILEECKKIIEKQGKCKTGEAVMTTAGNLPAKFVIHTVGPVWTGGNNREPEKLASCYRNSLLLAVENNLRTISFPNISTGAYGYPKKEAAQIAVQNVAEFLSMNALIAKNYFVCFDEENFLLYRSLLKN
jgi:O-acetyl-ADP-ribose deacetylase (regulator of RNase III)